MELETPAKMYAIGIMAGRYSCVNQVKTCKRKKYVNQYAYGRT